MPRSAGKSSQRTPCLTTREVAPAHSPGKSSRLSGRLLGALVITPTIALAGCSTMPTSGPASSYVRAGQSDPESVHYALVRLTADTERVLVRNSRRIDRVFTDRRGPPEIRFGIGDTVSVTLFESMAGGLFTPTEAGTRQGNYVTLPNQAVNYKGNITVPYGGSIRAAGRTPEEVQNAIVKSLQDRAIEPQAVVALVDQKATSISVLGEVGTPARLPASASGERLLDIITRAGGPKNPGFDTWVTLERDGRQGTAPFGSLLSQPANNIFVRPQDTVYVFTQPQTFLAMGASGQQGQFSFGAWRLTLAEAMAKAGGLKDDHADPGSVFIYRGEPREVAKQLGVDCTRYSGPLVPVIYILDLRDPGGYFIATEFEMRNKDVIFASNANSVEATKFMTYLRLIIGTVSDPIVAGIDAYTLKGLANGSISGATTIVTSSR